MGDETRDDAARATIELAQQVAQDDGNENGLERRNSQWVFTLFGRRREGGDDH